MGLIYMYVVQWELNPSNPSNPAPFLYGSVLEGRAMITIETKQNSNILGRFQLDSEIYAPNSLQHQSSIDSTNGDANKPWKCELLGSLEASHR